MDRNHCPFCGEGYAAGRDEPALAWAAHDALSTFRTGLELIADAELYDDDGKRLHLAPVEELQKLARAALEVPEGKTFPGKV